MSSTAPREAQRLQADVLIIGAGPAGIAALLPLLEAGRRVIWVEQSAQAVARSGERACLPTGALRSTRP